MKKEAPAFFLISAASLIVLAWIVHRTISPVSASTSFSPKVSGVAPVKPTLTSPPPDPTVVTQNEWQQLRSVRDATLQANPDLNAEYKELVSEMKAQQARFDQAMIKADPKVAPIVAKLLAMREHSKTSPSTPSPK